MSRSSRALPATILVCLAALAAILVLVPSASALGISPALRKADHVRDRSDRALISDARAQRACTRERPARCNARRVAVQKAGRRLARADRQFAHKSVLTERRALIHPRQDPPTIYRKNGELTWTKVADVRSYLVIRKAPGMTSQYTVVKGRTFDPPVVPGKTITYRVRSAVNGSAWSPPVSVSYAAKPREESDSAPIASLSGSTLTWTKVGDVDDYVVVRRIAGRTDVYSAVHGTSLQLPEVSGATASYSVRTAVTDSAWSSPVSISFPAAPAPAAAPTPAASTSQAASIPGFQVGVVMRTWEANDRPAAAILKPKLVRFEFDATNPASGDKWVEFYRGLGAKPQPLAGFNGVPSNAQIDSLAAHIKATWAGKVANIELGNEDSFAYKYGDGPGDGSYQARARAYAAAAKRLGQALAGSGIGVLAQADDGGTGQSVWVDQMFAAAPDLQNWVAGWTVHPYGPGGADKVRRIAGHVARYDGGRLKFFITEVGVASDNGSTLSDNYGWAPNMTYQAAAETLRTAVAALRATGKVAQVILYQSTDQRATGTSTNRESFFGLVQTDGKPKGALTQAAIELLAG